MAVVTSKESGRALRLVVTPDDPMSGGLDLEQAETSEARTLLQLMQVGFLEHADRIMRGCGMIGLIGQSKECVIWFRRGCCGTVHRRPASEYDAKPSDVAW